MIDSLIYFPWDIFVVSYERKREGELNKLGWWLLSLILGIVVGWLSLAIVQEVVLQNTWLRILNLILAPFMAGIIALKMSRRRHRKALITDNKFHYLVGFLFTLGFVAARYVLGVK